MTLFTTIAFFAAAQGFFLSLVLFFMKRGNRKANAFLALIILCLSFWTVEFAAYFTEYLYRVPHLLFSTVGLPLLFGPFLLFYAQSLNGDNLLKKRWIVLHFLPFLLYTLYYCPFYFETTAFKLESLRQLHDMKNPPAFKVSFFINEALKFLHLVAYLVWTHFYIKKKKTTKSLLLPLHTQWLKKLMLGLALFAFFDLLHLLSLLFFQYDYLFSVARITLLLGAVVVYFIGYATLRQPEIIAGQVVKLQKVEKIEQIVEIEVPKTKPATPRYEKSSLNEEKANKLLEILLQKMENEKLWLNSELKLQDLAEAIPISKHHLSQLLNEHLQKKFFDFVNEYRVQAAQKMLSSPKFTRFTILAIAYEAGFKNKATFNSAFKKYTGMTPSQYKKQHLKDLDISR